MEEFHSLCLSCGVGVHYLWKGKKICLSPYPVVVAGSVMRRVHCPWSFRVKAHHLFHYCGRCIDSLSRQGLTATIIPVLRTKPAAERGMTVVHLDMENLHMSVLNYVLVLFLFSAPGSLTRGGGIILSFTSLTAVRCAQFGWSELLVYRMMSTILVF